MSTESQVPRARAPRPNATRVILLVGATLVALAGCPSRSQTPEETLKRFIADVNARRADAVWDALSSRSRTELKARAQAVTAAAGEKSEPTPAQILFERTELLALSAPESISVASPIGQEVTLRVSVKNGPSANVRMVKEGAAWKVDLVPSLEPLAHQPGGGAAVGGGEDPEGAGTSTGAGP